MNKKLLKSIWAVFAGMLVIVVLSLVTDMILEGAGILTPPSQGLFITWMIILVLIYRSIYTVIGAYLTAKLAPANPMRHAIILGTIGVILSFMGIFASAGKAPMWFPVTLTILTLPCAWLGGKWFEAKNKKK
jgi:hypothetical protein